jgi:serine/threonine-protein kinase
MLRARQTLGKYRIIKRVADGGFANVFDAYDTIEGVHVALKVPHQQLLKGSARDDLYREVRLTAGLSHPHILSIKNASEEQGKFAIAYPLGRESLADRLTRRVAPRTALKIAEELLSAVAFAHKKRIIHRDIKPENVILLPDGRACLTDFGIARVALRTRTIESAGSGTLGYMAPEQAMGKPSFRSDVFSLGLVFWRMFSGALPEWPFTWPLHGLGRIRRVCSPEFIEFLRKACSVNERQRFANAEQMQSAFRKVKRRALLDTSKSDRAGGSRNTPSWKQQREREFKRLAGRSMGEHTHCDGCGAPVAERMRFCPWCRKQRATHEGPTNMPKRCDRCGRGMKHDWSYCAWCYGPKNEQVAARAYRDKHYVKRCANANCDRRQVLPFSVYCPWCQSKVRRPWLGGAGAQRCGKCNWGVFNGFWDYCPWCGHPGSGRRKLDTRRSAA